MLKDIIITKSLDTGFGHLVDSIITHGFESVIGWDRDYKEITEGHHRFVAALLLGMDWVYTSDFGAGSNHTKADGTGIVAHGDWDSYPIDVDLTYDY
jgi:hypothetical protein